MGGREGGNQNRAGTRRLPPVTRSYADKVTGGSPRGQSFRGVGSTRAPAAVVSWPRGTRGNEGRPGMEDRRRETGTQDTGRKTQDRETADRGPPGSRSLLAATGPRTAAAIAGVTGGLASGVRKLCFRAQAKPVVGDRRYCGRLPQSGSSASERSRHPIRRSAATKGLSKDGGGNPRRPTTEDRRPGMTRLPEPRRLREPCPSPLWNPSDRRSDLVPAREDRRAAEDGGPSFPSTRPSTARTAP